MEALSENELGVLPLENEFVLKHIPVHLSGNTFEVSFLSDNLLTSSPSFFTSSLNDTSSVCNSNCRAIFTIHLPTYEILVVNSAACQLVNFASDELCSMKLENLVLKSHRHKLSKLYENFIKNYDSEVFHTSGKLIEFIKKDGDNISVSVYLKKIDNPERCLAIAEPLERRLGLVTINQSGKILSFDEETLRIFKYDACELFGMDINILLPSMSLFEESETPRDGVLKKHLTGRTKCGEIFPLYLTVTNDDTSLEIYKVLIHVYTCLSGLILLNKKLLITNFNSYFIKLLFGYSKKVIVNKPITLLIPKFCRDIYYEKGKNNVRQNGSTDTSSSNCKTDFHEDWRGNSITDYSSTSFKSGAVLSFQDSSESRQYNLSNSEMKMHNYSDCDASNLSSSQKAENEKEDDSHYSLAQFKCDCEKNCNLDSEMVKATKGYTAKEGKRLLKQNVLVPEGRFLGLAKHSDGSFIEIKYRVQVSAIRETSYYCIWLSRNLKKNIDAKESNRDSPISSQFNNTSTDNYLAKDTINSEHLGRPSLMSSAPQFDDYLTAGDYSKHYTNIKQIGKGAFGYVKMAFRDSDGLLVVTKFIKKQKISTKSWVYNSSLNVKIPLEISLLITLQHPNIVKVLDVFHNDSFVQLVMEKHGAGLDLFEFINRRPKCDESLKSFIFRQIISAVYYLDSLGILHRDIKDENVIINERFEIKLIDFGSATFMPPGETFSKFYGTVGYCSPEVLQGNAYKGPELEIWALGVTLYVLTFGENPFYDIKDSIKGEFCILFPISKALNDLLHRMLDKNVETRITIDKVVEDVWVNQPVAIENYRFEDVVKCSYEEAVPSKYVHEISAKELESRTNSYSDKVESSNQLNGSTQILSFDTLEDLDDDFLESPEVSKSVPVDRKSSVMLSSTPLNKKDLRLCKSSVGLYKQMENSLNLNPRCCESLACEQNFEVNNFKNYMSDVFDDKEDLSGPIFDICGDFDMKGRFENSSLDEKLKKMTISENED